MIKYFGVGGHSRLAELDQVLVRGPRVEAANVQVRFAQLFPAPTAAVATAVGVGTGGRHLVAGGHIGLLQRETQTQDFRPERGNIDEESTSRVFSRHGTGPALSVTVQGAIRAIS